MMIGIVEMRKGKKNDLFQTGDHIICNSRVLRLSDNGLKSMGEKMILGLIIICGLITVTLYCCLVVASRYDDMMGYDDYYDSGKEE